jgi:Phage integrase family
VRISAAQRIQNENRIRAAMDRLLRGEIPPDGNCDVKTLARAAGVDRAAFYGDRPYTHLRIEFEQRLRQSQRDGHTPDPKAAQIERLRADIDKLKNPSRAGKHHDRSTHRLPHPGTGTAGRPTRRDPASTRCHRPDDQRYPPARRAITQDDRAMLTHHGTVSSITIPARLSRHEQRPASHPAHPRSSSSNATRTHPNTNFAEKSHTAAMQLLHSGIDIPVIALWLGHDSVETTQIYLHADLALKEKALARIAPPSTPPGRYHPPDALLAFLDAI